MTQKTVFISYRRAKSKHLARSIYMDLTHHGWDAFFDIEGIDSGDFDRIILGQIAARAHFVLIISPGSLERCQNPGDWVLREVQEAVRLKRNIVPVVEDGTDFEHEMGYLPPELRGAVRKKNYLPLPDFYFEAGMTTLRTRFLKTPEYVRIQEASAADRDEVQRRKAAIEAAPPPPKPARPRSADLLPQPFDWIEIPGGRGTMKTDDRKVTLTIPTERYWIGKYPVTNAQYALFIDAGGYRERQWWTDAGWQARENKKWTEPRYWQDDTRNPADHPVVGVSWYEAVAFCRWLSDATGEQIMLPTEAQWQYAAQGDDGREYPWGDEEPNERLGNFNMNVGRTTPVTAYPDGASPFGVFDMAGNVWEWCLTDYKSGSNNVDGNSARVLRGGSWYLDDTGDLRCAVRPNGDPDDWDDGRGFRCARL